MNCDGSRHVLRTGSRWCVISTIYKQLNELNVCWDKLKKNEKHWEHRAANMDL